MRIVQLRLIYSGSEIWCCSDYIKNVRVFVQRIKLMLLLLNFSQVLALIQIGGILAISKNSTKSMHITVGLAIYLFPNRSILFLDHIII